MLFKKFIISILLILNASAVYAVDIPLVEGDGVTVTHTVGVNAIVATDSTKANFIKSGALTCGAATQGKALVHTTPLQYCDNTATPVLRYAAFGAVDGDALAGDNATAFFDAGILETAIGGTGTTTSTGSGSNVLSTSPSLLTPALGTPSALVGTNITGTGASFTAGSATALVTGRTIGMTGDVVWTSTAFDGTANVTGVGTIQVNSVALTTDTTGNYAAGDAEAGAALTGDTATAFFSTGIVEVAVGGTGTTTSTGTGNTVLSTSPTLTSPNLASVRRRVFVSATAGFCRLNLGCTDATQKETTTNKVNYFSASFAADADDFWQTTYTFPEHYVNAGTFTFAPEWTGTTEASATVRWCMQISSITDDDPIDTAFGTAVCVNDDVTITGDFQRAAESGAITASGSPIGGDRFHFQIFRDPDNVADDATNPAELLGHWITYDIDKLSTED